MFLILKLCIVSNKNSFNYKRNWRLYKFRSSKYFCNSCTFFQDIVYDLCMTAKKFQIKNALVLLIRTKKDKVSNRYCMMSSKLEAAYAYNAKVRK